MNKLIAIVVSTLVLTSVSVKAEITNAKEFCDGAVQHAWNYASKEEAKEIHEGYMLITNSKKVTQPQMFMSMIMFTAAQQFSYTYDEDGDIKQQAKDFLGRIKRICMEESAWHTPSSKVNAEKPATIF